MAEENAKTEEEVKVSSADDASGEKASGESAGELTAEQKIIEELKEKAKTAEERASTAERERDSERAQKDTARKEAMGAVEKQISAQEEAVKSAKAAAQSNFDAAQQMWDEAEDIGDKTKKREAQIKLNDAQMKLRGAEYQEEQFNKWKEQAKNAPTTSATREYTSEEKNWIRKNPRFNDNQEFKESVYAADAVARARGIQANTPAYFKHVDDYLEKIGLKGDGKEQEEDGESAKAAARKTDKKSSTAAPPASSSGSANGSSRSPAKEFKMTAAMQEMARDIYAEDFKKDPKIAYEKYAKRQMEIAEMKAKGELK